LLSIPKTLAVNAAKDSTDLIAKLRSYHNAAQNAPSGDPKKALLRYGLDLMNGEVRDNVAAGVLEPTMSKVKSLKSAYEAAVSLLRIDDAIQCVPGEYCKPGIILTMTYDFLRTKGRAGPTRALVYVYSGVINELKKKYMNRTES
jgi:chaperonin GroEL (HSP60 family)